VAASIAVGGLGALEVARRLLDKVAVVNVVDFAVESLPGSYPRIKVKLRNTGQSVAFVKLAELILDDAALVDDHAQYLGDIIPKRYSWLVTERDVNNKVSKHSMSRKINPSETDTVEFLVGLDRANISLRSTATLRIWYDSDNNVTIAVGKLIVVNEPGAAAIFMIPESSRELESELETAQDPLMILQIIEELTARNDINARALIRQYLRSPETKLKLAAAKYFARVADSSTVVDLANGMKDGTTEYREQAYRSLLFQAPFSLGAVVALLNDDDPRIRELAATLLAKVPEKDSELALMQHLTDNGVVNTIAGNQIFVAAAAIRSLAELGSQELVPQLFELLMSENRSIRFAAIDACVKLKVKRSIGPLVDMLESPELRLRAKAHDALVQLTGSDHGRLTRDWLDVSPALRRE
jgi:HEAT repeat protein